MSARPRIGGAARRGTVAGAQIDAYDDVVMVLPASAFYMIHGGVRTQSDFKRARGPNAAPPAAPVAL